MTCPTCGSTRVRMCRGELYDVQEYDNGARYLRGSHDRTCKTMLASRESWEQHAADAAEAQKLLREYREKGKNVQSDDC